MNPSEQYILENHRVLLRPLEEGDFEYLLPYALDEPELWTYSLSSAAGEAGLRQYIGQALAGRRSEKEYPFIVYDKQEECYAGSSRFYDIQPANKSLQLGYTWYGKRFQGSGLNKHCKYLLLKFAFEDLGMERVEFRADEENARSIAAMKSIGCQVEGVLRSNGIRPDGSRLNSIVLSILRKEWQEGIRQALERKLGIQTEGGRLKD